ncbi:MAG: LA2681 family HEPN domain-containing protein [Proteobacteria bacterium]|nr:LA2681 family HEPN domain-containing protein [Pseudomonadota bacterium]
MQKTPRIRLLRVNALRSMYRYKEAFGEIELLEMTPDVLIERAAVMIDWCSDHLYGNCQAPPYDIGKFLREAVKICDELICVNKFKLDAIYFKANALSALENITESRLLLHQATDESPHDWQLWTQAIINLGNSYQQEGRFIEAIENYLTAINRMPAFSMGWSGLGSGLSHAFYHMGGEDKCPIYAALYCFYKANQVVDLQDVRYVNAIKTGLDYVLSLFKVKPDMETVRLFDPLKQPDGPSYDGHPFIDFFYNWATNNHMFLNFCLGCKQCENRFRDKLLIGSLISQIEDCKTPYNLFSYFAEIRREYFVARWLFVKTQYPDDYDLGFLNSIYEEIDLLDYASDDLRNDLVKMCLQKCVGVLDKIAFFLNEYEQLNIPHHRVWFSGKGSKPDIFSRIETKYGTLKVPDFSNLNALKSISTDLKHPYFEVCRNLRDSITHKYLRVHLDFASVDSLRYPGNGESIVKSLHEAHHDRENPRNYHVSESHLKGVSLRTLKMTRAAIFYLAGHIRLTELKKHSETPGKIIPSLYFENIRKR